MPARATDRRTRRAPAAVALLALVVLAGACGQQRDPTSYSAKVGVSFVSGCAQGFVPKNERTDPQATAHKTFCTCLYKELSNKQTGIKFSEFAHAQELIRTEPENPANRINKIIPNYDAYVAKCPGGAPSGP